MDPNSPQSPEPQQPNPPVDVTPPFTPAAPQPGVPPSTQPVSSGANGLSIAGLVLAFIFPLVGLILSIIGLSKAKKNHQGTGVAIAGIIVSCAFLLIIVPMFVALTLVSFNGVQMKARDTEREVDIKSLHGQVESYYAQSGKYPTLNNMNDSSWRSANLPALDAAALIDPKGTSDSLASTPAPNTYAYEVADADGNPCDNVIRDCAKYTLTTRLETGNTYYRTNLN